MTGALRNQVEVVIINWKRPRNVATIVDALRNQTIPCTITICDNHHSPEFEPKHETHSSADRIYRWEHPAGSRVRVFNQMTETRCVVDLAKLVARITGADIDYAENPRSEAAENELTVGDNHLRSGFRRRP